MWDSRTSVDGAAPSGGAPATRAASPSVRTRSGAKVSRASRAPSAGAVPKALAMTSPSPRNTSAQATAQYSARVTPGRSVLAHAPSLAALAALAAARSSAASRVAAW